jgi:tetratricopeptide (TPR) repeat protein
MDGRVDSRSRWSRLSVVLLGGCGVLVANSAYLLASGSPSMLYVANVLLHVVLGVAVLAGFLAWWWVRRSDPRIAVGGVLLVLSAACAGWLVWAGNLTAHREWLWGHIGLAVLGLVALLAGSVGYRHEQWWRASVVVLGACVPVATVGYLWPTERPERLLTDQRAPLTMADEAMGGDGGPFYPSSVHTASGGTLDSEVFLGSEECGRPGCHPDLVEQWRSSAHHFSSFNNQWYRKSIEYMQEVVGVVPSKWCGGCHDPALLLTGMMDRPIEEVIDTPEARAGLSCTACHLITEVRSTMGQGDYTLTVPAMHALAASDNPILQWLHDTVVRLDPEPHRRTFMQPFLSGEGSAELCATCHKVHLDVPVNGYRWVRGFNSYDNWQASGVSGFGARSFYYPDEPQVCVDCHMPRVLSDDPAADDGTVRSHRFPGANTALPVANRDEEQMSVVQGFLKARQVTVDIFALVESEAAEAAGDGLELEGPEMSTGFAVGEEQGMAVGRGGVAPDVEETVLAPVDRMPVTVPRGGSARVDVVVRTRGVGHFFPGGTVDAFDVWLELKATDDTGRVLFWSGRADEHSPVEPGAAFFRSLMVDAHSNPIDKRNAFATRATVYVKLIPPGAAEVVRFRLEVPDDAGEEITLEAKLSYRKFSWFYTNWAYAGVPDPDQQLEEPAYGVGFDDRRFVFTGDTSNVSGEVQEIPTLPIVVMARDTATVRVADEGLAVGEAHERPEVDRERWNDYGIGLLRQGDLRGAERAFARVTDLDPGWVDGWVNRGRVAVAEGDLDGAEEMLGTALEIEPQLARASYFAGLVDLELGEYDAALEHLRIAAEQYPADRVVRNTIGRVYFLKREFERAVAELEAVLEIDPEDLTAHYNLMLAHRGAGNMEASDHHRKLFERFKADESAQQLTRQYLAEHPHDNNRRQAIFEHRSIPLEAIEGATLR